jgi:hypothetical protein
MPIDLKLEPFNTLVGTWDIEATHPMFPSAVVHGTAEFEWLEGERFLLQRSRTDHPEFPDSLIVFGADEEGLSMNYFDSHGVHRIYQREPERRCLEDVATLAGLLAEVRREAQPRRRHDRRTLEVVPRRLDMGRRPCDHVPAQIATASAQRAACTIRRTSRLPSQSRVKGCRWRGPRNVARAGDAALNARVGR